MPKLVWVLLPLLPALGGLAWQVLRGRMPARRALNAWTSLLLMVYLLSTAALGLFWVAQQQLPVFDWHYLFGYATLLLLVLHLSLNLGSAWRTVTRRPAPVARDVAAGRRWVLGSGLAGLGLLALGGAFVAGLRLGRSERGVIAGAAAAKSATAPATHAADAALALVERFHAHSAQSRRASFTGLPAVSWGDAPPAFKRYPDAPRQALPLPARTAGLPLEDPAALGTALWHTAGVTERRQGVDLRASPSSGALFSTELYVAALALRGLEAGLWHYDAQAHALEGLRPGAPSAMALGLVDDTAVDAAVAVVVATAVFRRTGRKYRDRAYRYVLADLGHALENLRVAARAAGLRVDIVAAFDGPRLAATLGVDEDEEGVLALLALRRAGAASAVPRAGSGCAAPAAAGRLATPPLPRELPPLGVTGAVHRATSLGGVPVRPTDAARHRAPTSPSASGAGAIALPRVPARHGDVLRLIATRRSLRRFAATPLPLAALSGVLAGLELRTPLLSPAVRVDLVAHAVAGLPPGAYRYDPARHALLPRRVPRALRAEARAAALDQEVIGAAQAVLVLSADRAALAADPCGAARGYRHAFLETGLVGERVYLEAGARGLGACAVGAFYDEEAEALVGVDPAREWVLHFAALGVPAP